MNRYFFVHVQKTGGTALQMRLKEQFTESEIYPNASDAADDAAIANFYVPHLVDRWSARGEEIRMLTGHFPLCTGELLGGGFTTLTLLREPVERTLSYLRHSRDHTPGDRDKSLEEIYDDPFRFHGFIHDHMVKMLALRSEEMTDGMLTRFDPSRAHLERATENLQGVDVVGTQERFDDLCGELERRFGWDLGAPRFANRTRREDVPDSFRRRIALDNALDIELYDFAVDLVSERHGDRR